MEEHMEGEKGKKNREKTIRRKPGRK